MATRRLSKGKAGLSPALTGAAARKAMLVGGIRPSRSLSFPAAATPERDCGKI